MMKGESFKKGLAILLAVVMIIGFLPGVGSLEVSAAEGSTIAFSKPEGDGTEENPYQIGTAEELYWFADKVNNENKTYREKNAVLTADITVNTGVLNENGELASNTSGFVKWTPIGNTSKCNFRGTFDGQNHTISGLYFDDKNADYVGLIGYLYSGSALNASASNVNVVDSYFNGKNYVGGVCGRMFDSTMSDCHNAGNVNGAENVGGVVGECDGETKNIPIQKCYNTGIVTGTNYVGGVCGYFKNGTITACYNTGKVDGTENIGGVCGYLESCIMNKCYFDKAYANNVIGGYDPDSDVIIDGDIQAKTTDEMHQAEFCTLIGYHSYQNEKCILCNTYKEANLTKDKYDINGDNEKDEVYEIGSMGQLYWFAGLVNGTLPSGKQNQSANAVLTKDIVVNKNVLNSDGTLNDSSLFKDWTPIGTENCNYQGTFNGQNHTISGLYFNDDWGRYVGLIGYLGIGGKTINVGAKDSYFKGEINIGGVCGYSEGGIIKNCYNTGNVSGSQYVSGVCGRNIKGTVQNCYNTGDVNGTLYVGGICGWNEFATIENCYNTGNVSGDYADVVYGNYEDSTIKNCYYKIDTGYGSGTISKTTEQFQSGEVAYLLQEGQEDNTKLVWGQKIGSDDYPVLCGSKVYKKSKFSGCEGQPGDAESEIYSNEDKDEYAHHTDDGSNGGTAYDNVCDVCGKTAHHFVNGTCDAEGCGYHQGVITNVSYPTKIVYSGDVANAEPKAGDFTVASGMEPEFTWYVGDVETDDLSTKSVLEDPPTNEGTYTLVVNAAGAENDGIVYTAAELRVLVTIAKAPLAGTVTLEGMLKCNETVTVNKDGITHPHPGALSYKWYRVDGEKESVIDGATEPSYTLTTKDIGKKIRVEVYAKNCEGFLSATTETTVNKLDGSAEIKSTSEELSKYWDETTILTPLFKTSNNKGTNNENVTFEYKKITDTDYTTTAPTDAGTYLVRVKVKADGIHSEAVSEPVEFTIAKVNSEVEVAPVAAKNLIYTQGKTVTLIDASNASVTGGQLQYALGENGTYSTSLPTVTAAGTYSVYYKVVGDQNHNDTKPVKIEVTVSKNPEDKDSTTQPKDSTTSKSTEETTPKEDATTQQPSGTTVSQPLKNGDVITDDKTKAKFEVTDVSKKEVTYNAPVDNKEKDITIPDTVTINGEVYKVMKISDNAFKGNKTVTNITIGSNIQTIGKNAFSGCKKLKTIVIQSKTLTDKKISKKAFRGISKKVVIKVPKKKLAAYKKLLKKKGLSSKNKVKGY